MPDLFDGEMEDNDHHGADHASRSHGDQTPRRWHQAPIYQRYWRHHQQVWSWFRHHELASGPLSPGNQMLQMVQQQRAYHRQCLQWLDTCQQWVTSQHSSPPQTQQHKPGRYVHPALKRKAMKRSLLRKKRRIQSPEEETAENATRTEELNDSMTADSDMVEVQMEFTPDMVDFFTQSAKHRQERDAKKSEGGDKPDKEEYTELGTENASHKATVAPPAERPGVKRTAEMRYLYGKGAAMIHGMETAMQLNFDRNTDRKEPKLWPNLPLNIIFT